MAEQIIGLAALERRLGAIGGSELGQGVMQRVGMSTVREAKLLVPRKTGNLGRTIHLATVTPVSARVVASAAYAAYVEDGTRPHVITPRAAMALRWAARGVATRLTGTPTKAAQRAGGAWAFAKIVHHPGTKAHPFLLPGARVAVATAHLLDLVVDRWNRAA